MSRTQALSSAVSSHGVSMGPEVGASGRGPAAVATLPKWEPKSDTSWLHTGRRAGERLLGQARR